MPAPESPKTGDPVAQLAQMLAALLQPTLDRVKDLEDKERAREHRPEPVAVTKKPWEEVIYVRALRDCTYPNKGDETGYPVYRRGVTEEHPGDVFLLMHREHLIGADHLEEVKDLNQVPKPQVQRVPQTSARGQKATTNQW